MTSLQTHLKNLGACAEAREWAGVRTPQQAWDECEHADWLLWWATKTSVNTHQQIVLASCICARTAEAAAWAAAWAAVEAAVAAAWAAEAAVEAAALAAAEAAVAAAWAAARAAEAAAHKTMCLKIRELLQCPYGVEK